MSDDDKIRVKPIKAGTKEGEVRALSQLRQETTDKSQKALESRMAFFDSKRDAPMQEGIESAIAKGISAIAELAQSMQKIIPEETAKKIKEYWEKLMLAF